jgi:hypothetical protein
MLSGMHQTLLDDPLMLFPNDSRNGCRLDELRARPNYGQYFYHTKCFLRADFWTKIVSVISIHSNA